MKERNEMFTENDFVKIEKGDIFSFDEDIFAKPEEQIIKIEMEWKSNPSEKTDLDISVIMLNENHNINNKQDLVFFNSERRWQPSSPIGSEDFNPLDGKVSLWTDDRPSFKNRIEWLEETLPLSIDNSVIGSWDDKGDDDVTSSSQEQIHVLLNEIDVRRYRSIAIIASVALDQTKDEQGRTRFLEGKKFGDVYNPIVRIYNATDNKVLAEYRLNNEHPDCDGICFGYIEYASEKWQFIADEKGYKGVRDGKYYRGGILQIANSFVAK